MLIRPSCSPSFLGPHRGSIPALVEIWRLRAQADFSVEIFSKPRGIKITLYPPPAMTIFTYGFAFHFLLSASKCPKVGDAQLKLIWNSLCCLLMLHGEVTKEFHVIPTSDEDPQGLQSDIIYFNILISYTTDYIEMWYMRHLINHRWMVLHVQSCVRAVTATHLVMSELCEKSVENKKSRGDHKAVEHGLENRLDVFPISSNILKCGINKNMKRTQKRMKSTAQFLCLPVPSWPISKASRT